MPAAPGCHTCPASPNEDRATPVVVFSRSIPVIAAGGCGTYEHMQQALDAGAHAVAAGAMFQFREATPKGASRYLHDHGYQVRL